MRKALSVIVPVLVVGFVLFMRFHEKGSTNDDVLTEAHMVIQTIEGYGQDPSYFDRMVDRLGGRVDAR